LSPAKQLPSLSNLPIVKVSQITIKKVTESPLIKNAVKLIINGQTKTPLTPIYSKSKVYNTILPPPEVVPECLNLTNMTSLGEKDSTQILQGDILSALAFDTTGKYLSIGDYGGRCIIFSEVIDEDKNKTFEYYMEFQAHDKEIDFYSNQEIPDLVS
jgi:hypothetical protein